MVDVSVQWKVESWVVSVCLWCGKWVRKEREIWRRLEGICSERMPVEVLREGNGDWRLPQGDDTATFSRSEGITRKGLE